MIIAWAGEDGIWGVFGKAFAVRVFHERIKKEEVNFDFLLLGDPDWTLFKPLFE